MVSPSPHSHRGKKYMTPLEVIEQEVHAGPRAHAPCSIQILSTLLPSINIRNLKYTTARLHPERPARDKTLWAQLLEMALCFSQCLKSGRKIDRGCTFPWKTIGDRDHEDGALEMASVGEGTCH